MRGDPILLQQDLLPMCEPRLRTCYVHRIGRASLTPTPNNDLVVHPDRPCDIGDAGRLVVGVFAGASCRLRIPRSSNTPHGCSEIRDRCGFWGSTRPAGASPAGSVTPTAGVWVRVDSWDTGCVDLGGDRGLPGVGQAEGSTSAASTDWLRAWGSRDEG